MNAAKRCIATIKDRGRARSVARGGILRIGSATPCPFAFPGIGAFCALAWAAGLRDIVANEDHHDRRLFCFVA